MTERRQYAYRLTVDLPREPTITDDAVLDEDGWFRWPRWQRHYLSAGGAKKRADLLRHYGAAVAIERSEPIVWTETS